MSPQPPAEDPRSPHGGGERPPSRGFDAGDDGAPGARPARAAEGTGDQAPSGSDGSASTTPGTGKDSGGSNRGLKIGALVLALVLIAGVIVALVRQSGDKDPADTAGQPAVASPTGAAAGGSGQPSSGSTATVTSVPGCMPATSNPIVPTSMTIEGMDGVKSKVLALGLDSSGAAAAPPKDEPTTVAWYKLGPKPGSAKGHVVLSIHTYHNGGALGNDLYDSKKGLKKGDIIRLSDAQGRTVCYRYDHLAKISVADYKPGSTVLYNDNGSPQTVICICWDYVKATKDWDSRILFYATPITK